MINKVEFQPTPSEVKQSLLQYWEPISRRSLARLSDPNNSHKSRDAIQVCFYNLLEENYFEKIGVDWQTVPSGLSAPYPSGLFIFALTKIGYELEYLYALDRLSDWTALIENEKSNENFQKLIIKNFHRPSSATYPGRYQVIPPLVSTFLPDKRDISVVDLGGSIGAGLPFGVGLPYSKIVQSKQWQELKFPGKSLLPPLSPYIIQKGVIVDKIDQNSVDADEWARCCIWPGIGSKKVLDEINQGVKQRNESGRFQLVQADVCDTGLIVSKNNGRLFDVVTTFFLRYILPRSVQENFENIIRQLVNPGIWISEGDGLINGRTTAPWDVQIYRVGDDIEHLGNPFDLTEDQQRIGEAKADFWEKFATRK